MIRILTAGVVALILAGISPAQGPDQIPQQPTTQQPALEPQTPAASTAPTNAPQASPQPTDTTRRISPGSVIPVELAKSIDAKKIKSGDEVTAKITQDLKATNGDVVFPKDTKVIGHVTAAQPRSKEQKESDLGIAFDHAVLKDGSEVKMPLSIQAIIAAPNANSANDSNSGGYAQPSAPSGGGMSQSGANSRPGGMGGSTPPPQTAAPTSDVPADAQTSNSSNGRPAITTKTQGVVGISDLKLTTTAPNAEQGSLVTSEKNNVKLESGTLMLLRVN